MKKLLILLLLLLSLGLIGSAYAEICDETSTVQKRNGYLFLSNQTQLFSGENICIYENGQYKVQGEYTNGLKDGKWTWWHENGQKKEEGNYKDGKLDGKLTWWHENGQKYIEGNYKDFMKDGKWTWWHENGQKWAEGNYDLDYIEGKYTRWHEDGRQELESFYKKGDVFYKFLLKYYDNGQIESKSKFMMSKTNGMNLNGKTTFWYRSGQKLGEGNYKEGKSDGMWTWWNNKGQRVENANFKDGDLLNKTIFKYSYFTGRLKSEKNYIDGKCISGC